MSFHRYLQGDLDALLQYIDDNGDVNQRDRDNNTPLHWACQESHFDIVGVLMSRNAAVDPVNDLQSTPLHYACREVRFELFLVLIMVVYLDIFPSPVARST